MRHTRGIHCNAIFYWAAALLVGLSLTACGGGGGDSGSGGDIKSRSSTSTSSAAPPAPVLSLSPQSIKTFSFSWSDVSGETEYRLLENPDGATGYTQVASMAADTTTYSLVVPLHQRVNASYMLQACNSDGCSQSSEVLVGESITGAIGYVKASNTGSGDEFGKSVALSADGSTLAVGAWYEDSNATGINGDQTNKAAIDSGAVYVFTRSGTGWSQQAYIKASNAGEGDQFGVSVALAANGSTLVVGAYMEDSNSYGINGDQTNDYASDSGAVYVFTRSDTSWSQQAYIKPSRVVQGDQFGLSVALAADGSTLAVGANTEGNNATGINGDPYLRTDSNSGAVYVFARSSNNSGTSWSEQAYIKASNTEGGVGSVGGDHFGVSIALAADGNTLAVGAYLEDSSSQGIDGDQTNNGTTDSGAVYVFTRSGDNWSQQAYVKASNTGPGFSLGDVFGLSVALSVDGNTLAVGAFRESSNATGINGDQTNDDAPYSGAVYVFTRSGDSWSQQAYVKAPNTGVEDQFGNSVALSADGKTLAVAAYGESSNATGINGDQTNDDSRFSGAVYLY